jgi:hypothetical protein
LIRDIEMFALHFVCKLFATVVTLSAAATIIYAVMTSGH